MMTKILQPVGICCIVCCLAQPSWATSSNNHGVDKSLYLEAQQCVRKALRWLADKQDSRGFWSSEEHPAVTALVLRSYLYADRVGEDIARYKGNIDKGFEFISSCVQDDGGIYVRGYENYNTAICLLALVSRGRAEDEPVIADAHNYLTESQMDEKVPGKSDGEFDGGIGYNKTGHSDVNNTAWAMEAIYYVKKVYLDEEEPTVESDPKRDLSSKKQAFKELNWDAALAFLSRCQNLPETNDQSWAGGDPANRGGFVYYPGNSKAGEMKGPDGTTVHRSYGSISYAGLLSLLLCDLGKSDPRVVAAYDWIQRNYTLEENPGVGQQGLYFYYHVMAKALNVFDTPVLSTPEKGTVHWRKELLRRYVSLQKNEGYWVNDTGRWMENDPALTTAYSVLGIEMAVP